ncbi:phosphonate ABC transporter [Hydrogenophaga crassostreae]|uniref:Phosphonate ABC transporter n=1 Tax=Hydrogenophaga crassostreae TaxID=1763535 RepID=A0A167ITE7_9BURK|nr:ATP-binding cassette domain-containing protein [Hydrogenophaga crassostreae]AOW14409.1 phosphonate ABC transporter [Hydrogenophaga crassostreae]OAD43566.1 phosphonate ABC transporter [Hydrogenophaga crassostreae]
MKLAIESIVARHPAARDDAEPALRGLSLAFASGEQVAVIGPSGAGKTTLLQILACAMPPASGAVRLNGESPWDLPRSALQRLRGRLLLAPQVPPLPPRQRVITAVLAARLPAMGLWASVRSLFYPADIPAAFDALEQFDLGDKIFERVDRLSGGERQRVGLARTLLAPAELWLVDEPLSALDPTRARQAMQSLTEAAHQRGATLISTLHQVDMALAHFPRVIGLRDGRLAFDLPTAEVTPEQLARLYDQFEHELLGETAPAMDDVRPAAPPPAVMHCR